MLPGSHKKAVTSIIRVQTQTAVTPHSKSLKQYANVCKL